MKQVWKPTTILSPVPVVMVSCTDKEGNDNIVTIAWVGTINSEPPMLSISVRPERHSYHLIRESGQFVVNLVTEDLAKATDYCGVKSGRDVDKFKETGLTREKSENVMVPAIKESPINIECVVKDEIKLGTHSMFVAEIVAVKVDDSIIDDKGSLCLENSSLVAYSHGAYWTLGECLGYFGYSVTKDKTTYDERMKKFRKDK